MGRDTTGVRGIRLRPDDGVVSAACDADGDMVLLLTSGGYGKRTKVTEFPRQKRGGLGVKAIKPTRVRGTLVAARGAVGRVRDLRHLVRRGGHPHAPPTPSAARSATPPGSR